MVDIFNDFQNFIVSIGTETLKEKGEKKYNDKKIMEELKEYITEEFERFKYIDINKEIDFEGLQLYINENMLDDFKACLIGKGKERETKKENIIESIYYHVGANSYEKKEYVKHIFETTFDIINNFYETKIVGQEDLYVANRIVDDVNKKIEELAHLNTKTSEQNVFNEGNIHKKIYINADTDMVHKIVMNKFIKKRYRSKGLDLNYNDFSDLFKLFVQVTDENMEELSVNNLFDFVKEKIESNSSEDFIKVLGPDGTGKSTFLSILYMYLYQCYLEDDISIYPFYINLHYYDRAIMDAKGELKESDDIKQMLINDIELLINVGKTSNSGILIIIDGNESYFRTTLKTGVILKDIISQLEGHKKIICVGERTNVHSYRQRREVMYLDVSTSFNFIFQPIFVDDVLKYRNFVNLFFKIMNVKANNVLSQIDKFKMREIDFNFLSIFNECLWAGNMKEIKTISDLYRKYCILYFKGDEEKIEYCNKLAYKYFMTREEIKQDIISKNWEEWELIHQHKTISNYFLASYYGNLILEYDGTNKRQLECVFTNGINIFLKSIINENIENQKRVEKNCKKIYENGNYLAKAQAVYLLGRIENRSLCQEIKEYLEPKYLELFKLIKTKRNIENEKIFLFRTISVSLFTLGGNDDKGKNLLEKLLTNSSINEINRAFFLQYYDDVRFEPEQINFQDNGDNAISFTFNVLLNQIHYQLEKKHINYWSSKEQYNFQINLFTLCSLVQVRLDRQLEAGYINETKEIVEKALHCDKANLTTNMNTYLLMLKEDIEKKIYNVGHIYKELYAAKDVIRSGWINKIKEGSIEVDRYENIVEHMYYTWLLGMLYLPENIQTDDTMYKYYNKNKILNCILVHDLAETYVGDKRPEESTYEHRKAEIECMNKFFMHDTYNDIYSMDSYRKVWKFFELDSSDINGRIAKELDIIQSIYQFYVYKQKGAVFEEKKEKEWRIEKRKIKTTVGRKILAEVVLKTFGGFDE